MAAALPFWWLVAALLSLGTVVGIALSYWQAMRRRMELVLAAAPGARFITDLSGEPLFANAPCRAMLGLGSNEVLPGLTELLGLPDFDFEAALAMVRAGGRTKLRATLPGEDRAEAAEIVLFPMPERRGRIIWDILPAPVSPPGIPSVAETDGVTPLAALLDDAPFGCLLVSAEGEVIFGNHMLAEWTGRPIDSLRDGSLLLGKVLLTGADGRAGRVLAKAGGTRAVRILRRDDEASGQSQILLFDAASGGGSLGGPESQFRRYFDFAPIGILVLDTSGLVTEANGAAAGIFVAGGAKLAGRKLVDLVRAEDRPAVAQGLAAARRGEAVSPLDLHISPDGSRVVQLFFAGIEGGGEGGSQLAYLVDLSEQKRLESQFAQSQKMQAVGQLAGGIAHDFNNLLTAMIGFCDLLLMRHQPGEQTFADVMQIKQNASRAANLVRQLLAFSRRQTLRPKVIDITDVLADLRNLLARLIGETIELKLIHGRDLWPVKVDQSQLEQVIINLVVNARDAINAQNDSASGGRLVVRSANEGVDDPRPAGTDIMPPGDYVLIEVSDTGHGIAPEHLPKIFEPFFTTKPVGAGTGLGLSTVYGIIKQTGGFVAVESQPGQGATFRVFLPRYRPGEDEASEPLAARGEAARDLTGKGRVLLVEDEDAVRTFAARALRNKGYTVLEANSGDKALEVAGEEAASIDVLVSDIVMPGMDGPSLAVHLRERRPDLRIIFISGYAEDAVRKNMDRIPEVSFLAKPFSLADLAAKVKEVLEAKPE